MEKEILEILKAMQEDIKGLKSDVKDLKDDVKSLNDGSEGLKEGQKALEIKVDGIADQTADLTEFKTDVLNKLKGLKDVEEVPKIKAIK